MGLAEMPMGYGLLRTYGLVNHLRLVTGRTNMSISIHIQVSIEAKYFS